jgi:hypothetical protein
MVEYNWGRADAAWVKSGLAAVEQGISVLTVHQDCNSIFSQLHILHTLLIWFSTASG